MITSEDSAVSQSSFLGVWSVMSMPTSAIASTAAGLIVLPGAEPAERTSTVSPARWRSQPAAIWERPALCTQTNRTLGLSLMRRSFAGCGNPGVEPRARVQGEQQADADQQPDELGDDEAGHRRRGDAGERVGERPADGGGGVGEAGAAGEPVGAADVGAD